MALGPNLALENLGTIEFPLCRDINTSILKLLSILISSDEFIELSN